METFDSYGRNFDALAPKFKRKVYGGLKGKIRLEIIKRDLFEIVPHLFSDSRSAPLNILDAGCGSAPVSLNFARLGHALTLCDISKEMLEIAVSQIKMQHIEDSVTCMHLPVQKLPENLTGSMDIVLCHAVLEWVTEPGNLIRHLLRVMKKRAFLSLTFYNLHGMIFKNLLRTNYRKIKKEQYQGWEGSLTPTHPKRPDEVIQLLESHNFEILAHSGIRVFHDYILDLEDQKKDPQTVLDLEAKFSRQMPYRDLGRYQHMICRKKE